MKCVSIAFLAWALFSPFVAHSSSPFDFLEASRKLSTANSFRSSSSIAKTCAQVTSENNESVLSCAIKDEDYKTPIVKVDYDVDQVPLQIKSALPEKFIEDTKDKKISCVYRFKLINDNLSMKDKKKGDDYGRTHGMDVGVSCASTDGISTVFTYSTDLYTQPDRASAKGNMDGIHSMKVKFDSENIFQLLQDNINEGKVTYWKRGVGFINISNQEKWGLLQSSGQQAWYHHILNKTGAASVTEYQYQEGSKNSWGAFVILAVGLQENRKWGDSCRLQYSADIGGRFSSLKGASTLNLNLQTKFSYNVSKDSSLYLRAQSETTLRSTSSVTDNTLAAGIQSKTGAFVEMGMTQQIGNRKDTYDTKNYLTGKNDKLIFVRVGHQF